MRKCIILTFAALALCAGAAMAEVNINTATQAELAALPGIGAVKAAAIIEYRKTHGDFDSLSELIKVYGIGDATVADLKGKASVGKKRAQ